MVSELTSGIYKIVNLVNGRFYVGSAVDLVERWATHARRLRAGTHVNSLLQNAWNKHGAEAFRFEVLEYVGPEDLLSREQHWIDHLEAVGAGYNLCPTAGSILGIKRSAATREKMSKSQAGRKKSAEHVQKMSYAQTGKVVPEDVRRKISESRKGMKCSDEARANMSKAQRLARARLISSDSYWSPEAVQRRTLSQVTRKVNANSPTGFKGVTRCPKSTLERPAWRAVFEFQGKRYFVGRFYSLEQAVAARAKALEEAIAKKHL